SSGATAYDVKRSTVSGSGYVVVSSPTTTSYTNTGLTNGTTYYFVVAAKNASGSSANSSQVSATPTAAVPAVPTHRTPAPATATASTTNTGFSTSSVDDGDLGTRWASTGGDPQWIYIDLGTTWASRKSSSPGRQPMHRPTRSRLLPTPARGRLSTARRPVTAPS